jgi:hypothetical protein
MTQPYANIHFFDNTSKFCDVDGEPLVGYYYELMRPDGKPLCGLMGPYGDKAEAEAACNRAYRNKSY